jgi:CBS domain-containing protein
VDAKQEAVRTLAKFPAMVMDADATLREAAIALAEDGVGAVIVAGSRPLGAPAARPQGIASERDIVRALADGADPDAERIGNVMTLDLATAAPSDAVGEVAAQMLADEIRHMPLMDEEGVVVAVVSERDVLRALLVGEDR